MNEEIHRFGSGEEPSGRTERIARTAEVLRSVAKRAGYISSEGVPLVDPERFAENVAEVEGPTGP